MKYMVIILGYFCFSYFFIKNVYCGHILEEPQRGPSNEYLQHTFIWRNQENYPRFIINKSSEYTYIFTDLG